MFPVHVAKGIIVRVILGESCRFARGIAPNSDGLSSRREPPESSVKWFANMCREQPTQSLILY